MYQACIRDKKKYKTFNQQKKDNYDIDPEYEELAYVKKLLGNCRLLVITASGSETIGVIRGKFRKFNTRVLFEVGDIIVISKRDYQDSKVDIVHKYNSEQVQYLIKEGKLTNVLTSLYNNSHISNNDNGDDYINFSDKSITDDSEEELSD